MARIAPLARATARPGSAAALGGFGGLFDLRAAGFADPVLVAATDGVGTKLRIAIETGRLETIGIDLVAMCVNDVVVQGAEPLFFIDYFATGRLDVDTAARVIAGIATGCREAGCALIGGETAEMPGFYASGDFDLAGFAVGAAERDRLMTSAATAAGDIVLGLASSGLHSNGFSLVRRVAADEELPWDAPAPFSPNVSLGEALLKPTRIYVSSCLAAVEADGVHALAHITGGGLVENIPRVLVPGLSALLDAGAWPLPPEFEWLHRTGRIPAVELARTFNCGIGMALIVAPEAADRIEGRLRESGETVWRIGVLEAATEGTARVRIESMEKAWHG